MNGSIEQTTTVETPESRDQALMISRETAIHHEIDKCVENNGMNPSQERLARIHTQALCAYANNSEPMPFRKFFGFLAMSIYVLNNGRLGELELGTYTKTDKTLDTDVFVGSHISNKIAEKIIETEKAWDEMEQTLRFGE